MSWPMLRSRMGFRLPWNCACLQEDPQPAKRKRPKIDRSMIGEPTNFQHTGHIGTGDMGATVSMTTVKTQMESKGGHADGTEVEAVVSPASKAIPLEEAQQKIAPAAPAESG